MRTLLLLLLTFATPAFADGIKAGDLVITDTKVRETPPTAKAGAGYLSITNAGETADTLVAVEADFPRVMLHRTVMDGDVARMEHIMGGIPIPPGETVDLVPGGTHVMFMGLSAPFEVAAEIPATLIFEKAGPVEVVFTVHPIEELQ